MATRSLSCLSPVFALFLIAVPVACAKELPFQLISGNRAVIYGTVAGGHELAMLIDTGADCTVIDTRAARRLHLEFLPQTVEYAAYGKLGRVPLALVRDLKVGPISTSLACIVGDIPTRGVDMILGLNVLSKRNFEIDYERRKIVFDAQAIPSRSMPFEPHTGLVVIKGQVHDQTIRLLVDTGATAHCVFKEGPIICQHRNDGSRATISYMGSSSESKEVALKTVNIGSIEWKEVIAMATANPKPADWDVVLGVGSLGLKQIYFDFEHRLLSWTR